MTWMDQKVLITLAKSLTFSIVSVTEDKPRFFADTRSDEVFAGSTREGDNSSMSDDDSAEWDNLYNTSITPTDSPMKYHIVLRLKFCIFMLCFVLSFYAVYYVYNNNMKSTILITLWWLPWQ